MGGYVPNPLALGAAKVTAYAALGWTVRPRASRPGNPVVFGLARAGAGFLVGLAFTLLLSQTANRFSDSEIYLLFLAPRLLLWAGLLHVWFRPNGGRRALLLWSLAGTTVSASIDLVVLAFFEQFPWLHMSIC